MLGTRRTSRDWNWLLAALLSTRDYYRVLYMAPSTLLGGYRDSALG